MFENLSYLALQEYWWFLVGLLGALFVLMTFVQGGQTLLWTLGKSQMQKDILVNVLGRKWELTFTSLVMFGGALFAAFPLFYATSFGGAYYVWMAILFCFIIQAVAYEYRKKPNNFFGEKIYEWFLFINGSLGIILIGVALGTLFTGGNFVINDMHLSHWTKISYGLEAVLNPFNLAFGFMLFFISRILASLFIIKTVDDKEIVSRAYVVLKYELWIFLILFVDVVASILLMNGYSYNPKTMVVYIEHLKYLHNFLAMPVVAGMFVLGALMFLCGIFITLYKKSENGIFPSGLGIVFVVLSLFLLIGYNNTAYYPSLVDMQNSLTIQNSSGSRYTLVTMSYVSLLVPFVLAYIIIVWKAMTKEKISSKELLDDPHHY